ncbi:hypothetical protein [Gloeocapsopsis dulcis]|uniref:hypothetical protein n=1 Tax=Gloeocapsopsis dulcis TaxID=2859516 RepID=UPI00101ADC28|nr:hypothetical protein [Gloeocapsopsis dulcis]WNN91106.1 hypothetical protein P0S91_08525 [Gloeocapsopsis dulcis]
MSINSQSSMIALSSYTYANLRSLTAIMKFNLSVAYFHQCDRAIIDVTSTSKADCKHGKS